ncbi:adenosine deaminase-like, partial [Uloborus diversus]|uniref:adenosine deaminase-like n=1 Tax=Uloborus diversus TaxID=327109 RepID=UPI00240A0BB8
MEDSDIFFNSNTLPKYKIELHIHLDGAIRTSTLWELAKEKKIDLHVDSEEEFCSSLMVDEPTSLKDFLKPFERILPIIVGDLKAIERIAYEFCEDAAKENILYAEPRYSPHLLSSCSVTAKDVVKAVNKGLARGSKDFGVHVRTILCCVRGKS